MINSIVDLIIVNFLTLIAFSVELDNRGSLYQQKIISAQFYTFGALFSNRDHSDTEKFDHILGKILLQAFIPSYVQESKFNFFIFKLCHGKPCFCHMQTTRVQINLCNCTV